MLGEPTAGPSGVVYAQVQKVPKKDEKPVDDDANVYAEVVKPKKSQKGKGIKKKGKFSIPCSLCNYIIVTHAYLEYQTYFLINQYAICWRMTFSCGCQVMSLYTF